MTKPLAPEIEARVRASFAAQSMMTTIGARMEKLAPGECEIVMPFSEHIGQQHGLRIDTANDSAPSGQTLRPVLRTKAEPVQLRNNRIPKIVLLVELGRHLLNRRKVREVRAPRAIQRLNIVAVTGFEEAHELGNRPWIGIVKAADFIVEIVG